MIRWRNLSSSYACYRGHYSDEIQLSRRVIFDILCEVVDTNRRMLVFGLGHDSPMWHHATGGNTVFVEAKDEYIALNQDIESVIKYEYQGIDRLSSYSFEDKELDEQFPIPFELQESGPFDVILVDGPEGYEDWMPGRLLPIYWATKTLSRRGTVLYIDDAKRRLETHCIEKYVPSISRVMFRARNGTLKCVL